VPAAITAFFVERGHEVLNLRTMFGVEMTDEEIAAFGDRRDGVVVTWDRGISRRLFHERRSAGEPNSGV